MWILQQPCPWSNIYRIKSTTIRHCFHNAAHWSSKRGASMKICLTENKTRTICHKMTSHQLAVWLLFLRFVFFSPYAKIFDMPISKVVQIKRLLITLIEKLSEGNALSGQGNHALRTNRRLNIIAVEALYSNSPHWAAWLLV